MVDVHVELSKPELVSGVIRTLREAGYVAGQNRSSADPRTRQHVVIFKVADDKVDEVTGIVRGKDPGMLRLHPPTTGL